MTCKNNLRQQALGLKGYAQSFPEQLPSIWQRGDITPWESFSWRVSLLPYIEEQDRFDRINQDLRPLDPSNAAAAGIVEVFSCPSSPGSPRIVRQLHEFGELELGGNDYAPIFDVHGPTPPFVQSGTWFGGAAPDAFNLDQASNISGDPDMPGPEQRVEPDVYSAEIRKVPSTFRRVRDGLSYTVLLVEQAGKPVREGNGLVDVEPAPGTDLPTEGAWLTAEYASYYATGVNQDNHSGPFGYHQGASVAMCDGSVHFWSRNMSEEAMRALLTRDGSEIVDDTDW